MRRQTMGFLANNFYCDIAWHTARWIQRPFGAARKSGSDCLMTRERPLRQSPWSPKFVMFWTKPPGFAPAPIRSNRTDRAAFRLKSRQLTCWQQNQLRPKSFIRSLLSNQNRLNSVLMGRTLDRQGTLCSSCNKILLPISGNLPDWPSYSVNWEQYLLVGIAGLGLNTPNSLNCTARLPILCKIKGRARFFAV